MANDQAMELVNTFIAKAESYGIESNLYDQITWDFIAAHREKGYRIEMKFYCVSNVSILHERIKSRVEEGGHFVRPDIVEGRYRDGLHFIKLNFHIPDKLYIVDCTELAHMLIVTLSQGKIVYQAPSIPAYLEELITGFGKQSPIEIPPISDSIEEVRKRYLDGQ